MATFPIGIRKYVEFDKVQHWLVIGGREAPEDDRKSERNDLITRTYDFLLFSRHPHWQIFIMITILINLMITINCFHTGHVDFEYLVILVHITCLFYWIDFLANITLNVIEEKKKKEVKRNLGFVTVDAVSLLPFSTLYVLFISPTNQTLFWILRILTLLRFYRIPYYLSTVASGGPNHWKVFAIAFTLYFFLFMDLLANVYEAKVDHNSNYILIDSWNETFTYSFITCFYYSIVSSLNVGFGDIRPRSWVDMWMCTLAMIVGCSIVTGVITGTLATEFSNKEVKREDFRHRYNSTMNVLRQRKMEKRILEKTAENLILLWKKKKGFSNSPPIHILPLTMQKEISFDVNFALLNRSVIFSSQPRSYLRRISLLMKSLFYLPGDTILEPIGVMEMIIFVFSGVIEILSEENDETTLLSFTRGTILGEAALFISMPIKCVIKASTCVELQVLSKTEFCRMAVEYPEMYRNMKEVIDRRITACQVHEFQEGEAKYGWEFNELTRRKAPKRLLQDLRRQRPPTDFTEDLKGLILGLYTLSENIPKVKTIPLTLLKAKPWILRPNTSLTVMWDTCVVLVVAVAACIIPYQAGFVRQIDALMYTFLFITEIVYVIDVIFQCITAVEKEFHFSYTTSIKAIIGHRLRTAGFYLDILAAFNLSTYSDLIIPEDPDYAYLLLSLNKILKFWRIPRFFGNLENNMNANLLAVISIKYLFYLTVTVIWAGVILYLEACPGEICYEERWFYRNEQKAVSTSNKEPCTNWPPILSLYFGSMTVLALGYGDVTATAIPDCLVVILFILVGALLIAFCVAQISSCVKNKWKIRTDYQERVFAAERFMVEHELAQELQNKVRRYFQLQWNYDQGFSLQQRSITEHLPLQQKQILVTELVKILLTVPMFQEASLEFLSFLAKYCGVKVLPPEEIITEAGGYFREMYILEKGYCEVSKEADDKQNLQRRVIGPVNSLGFIEMILGTPLDITVQTLTHAKIIIVDYATYMRAVTKYPSVKVEIDNAVRTFYSGDMKSFEVLKFIEPSSTEQEQTVKPIHSKSIINVYKYHKTIQRHYLDPFKAWGKFRVIQFLFMPFVVLPDSYFLKIWMGVRIVFVLIIGLVAPIHFSLSHHTQALSIFILILQAFAWIDVYLMFHVAYYDKNGILMFHPAKTVTWYLKGNFAPDVITVFPFYLVIDSIFPREVKNPSLFYDGPGLIMVFQIFKFFQACHYLENDILRRTETIKILKFLPVTVIMTNFVTGVMILLECSSVEVEDYSNNRSLQSEYQRSIFLFCSVGNDTLDTGDLNPFRFYVMTFYWVTSTMTTCGFGDIAAHDKNTMIAVIVVALMGIIIYTYMFASLTGNMISAYSMVTKHRRRIKEMMKFMKDKEVNEELQMRFLLHFEYTWQRTEGGRPQRMFNYVYAALKEKIMASMYEGTISQIPAFLGVENPVVRVLGKRLDEIYYLRGEVIIKYKDIQEFIYVIYRGQVDILTKDGHVITSMGRGGIFGNISNKPFSVSPHIVQTTQNVDVLRVNSDYFIQGLQVYQNTRPLIKFLVSQKLDYIEPVFPSSELNPTQADIIPYEAMLSLASSSTYKFSGNLIRRRYFHFKKSIFKEPKKRCHEFFILPDSVLHQWISFSMMILAYISCTLTTYMFAFQYFPLGLVIICYIIDIMFWIKIAFTCNFAYVNRYGDYVVSIKKIKKRYFRSKFALTMDILANIPLEVFSFAAGKHFMIALSFLRLNRILRLPYVFQYFDIKGKTLMTNKISLQLCWITVITSLLIHGFSCLWYFAACPFNDCQSDSWVVMMSLNSNEKLNLWFATLYYSVTVMTTTGYGDVAVYSVVEMLICTTFLIISRFGVAFLAGTMAAVINVHSLNVFLFQERIDELKTFYRNLRISEYQMGKMWNYVTSLWLQETGKQIPRFIDMAPYAMKCEIMNAMFGNHLSQCVIFSTLEEPFIRQLAACLKRFVYFPGNYIVQQGDADHTMYFIHKGQVSVLTIHPDLMETIHFTLLPQDHFGLTQGLITGESHHFSYRAETNAEILSLTKKDWQHLLRYFPRAGQKIYKNLEILNDENRRGRTNVV